MSIEFTIVCDECSCIIAASKQGAWAARFDGRQQQGAVGPLPGGRDLCRDCKPI